MRWLPPDWKRSTAGIELLAPVGPEAEHLLTPEALQFVARLERQFAGRRHDLLRRRHERQARLDAGELPDFLPETSHIRQGDWRIAPLPADLADRRVEITGPVDRKMVINALNSGAGCSWPTSRTRIRRPGGARSRGRSTFATPWRARSSTPAATAAAISSKSGRPRSWSAPAAGTWMRAHVLVDGRPISASLFDFGLFLFHNAETLLAKGSGPYFYLPKLESHFEARLWNDVFETAQAALGLPSGTIKATVLIETILAAFEMDEILYELRNHSAGLNCGRWDYIFSFIKKFHARGDCLLPDRAWVTMNTHFLRSYSRLLIQTCHRRGAHAMGGMAAQIPIKNDPAANERALAKVWADKLREATDGHDGTWVAHPGLVHVAMAVFDAHMFGPNQIARIEPELVIMRDDLLRVPEGPITPEGLRTNVSVGVRYLEAWLRGQGCVPINNLMEDAATAEICRAQVWQWIRHPRGAFADGTKVTALLVEQIVADELARLREAMEAEAFRDAAAGRFGLAGELFLSISTAPEFVEFLTLPAYEYLA